MTKSPLTFEAVYQEALTAGYAAGEAAEPEPMTVIGHDKKWVVPEGVCGFAWISFKGNTPWGRWAAKHAGARKGYPSGMQISCHYFNQSMQRKEAFCRAFVEVLKKHGIDAYANSRMD